MASLFEDYEKSATRSLSSTSSLLTNDVTASYLTSLEDEVPIFNKHRMVNISLPMNVNRMAVANNVALVSLEKYRLLRFDLPAAKQKEEIELPQGLGNIINIFMDPTGRHSLITMSQGDVFYLFHTAKKLKPASKMKGQTISAVAWNSQNTHDNLSSPILLGTNKGLIFESELTGNTDRHLFQANPEQYFKQVYDLTHGRMNTVITGIVFEKIPSTLTESKYFVIVTTPDRIYQFLGFVPAAAEVPIFIHVFNEYGENKEWFREFPGSFGHSDLKLFYPKPKSLPTSVAWMTGAGILYADIVCTGKIADESVIINQKLFNYEPKSEDQEVPLGIVLTEFHVLLLYPDTLKAICVLNELIVFEDNFMEKFNKMLGITKDVQTGLIWSHAGQNIFHYKVVRESRDVWQLYLEKKEFELAKKYCQDNPLNVNKVLTKHAEHYFNEKEYENSAALYAETENSFEEIALKFLQVHNEAALKTFLLKKLAGFKPSEKTQMTMIVIWLTEIYLYQLGQLHDSPIKNETEYKDLQEEFHNFLSDKKITDTVTQNRNTIYDLMGSHGDQDNLTFFAGLMNDHERVIRYFIQHEQYVNALNILNKQKEVELFYQFSPILMQHLPRQTVDVWISKDKWLSPTRLIPALVQYDNSRQNSHAHEGIRYLEFCVHRFENRDQAIHNYLLALYAKLDHDKLLRYLHHQGQDPSDVYYDLKYALRLCSEYKHQRACVHIYCIMGLYEEAVDLALEVDVELAKQTANLSEDNDELKKKLWLRIARHVVEEEKDIKKAMDFIQECDLIKIEDILPFFPDFVTIDHFKDAICDSLKEYNKHIDMLKNEMTEATQSAQEIRGEIQAFRNKYSFVKAQDKCSSCSNPILTRAFYLFPCQHLFHSDCLIKEVKPYLNITKRNELDELFHKLAMLHKEDSISIHSTGSGTPSISKKEQIKVSVDNIIALECVYCGDYMISCIDKPFIEPEEYDEVMKSWE